MRNKILIVGEFLDKENAFPAKWLLRSHLAMVGVDLAECEVTNVFNIRPRPTGTIKDLCGAKPTALPGYPAVTKSRWIKAEHASHLDLLYARIRAAEPNIIIALGPVALWALCEATTIKASRGAVTLTSEMVSDKIGRSHKVLPTYHPSTITRQWNLRPVFLNDLDKARRESAYAEFHRPVHFIHLHPTLDDIKEFDNEYVRHTRLLSTDIETKQNQIDCFGVSPTPDRAIVIPFFRADGSNYWQTREEELAVWDIIKGWMNDYPTLFQNGMYDINFLWKVYGIPCRLACEDTMLLQHAYQPEMEKGLGFLATLYTDEAAWKHMGKSGMKHD